MYGTIYSISKDVYTLLKGRLKPVKIEYMPLNCAPYTIAFDEEQKPFTHRYRKLSEIAELERIVWVDVAEYKLWIGNNSNRSVMLEDISIITSLDEGSIKSALKFIPQGTKRITVLSFDLGLRNAKAVQKCQDFDNEKTVCEDYFRDNQFEICPGETGVLLLSYSAGSEYISFEPTLHFRAASGRRFAFSLEKSFIIPQSLIPDEHCYWRVWLDGRAFGKV